MDTRQAKLIEALKDNWRREMLGAKTYRALAEKERDPKRKEILIRIAEGEEAHALRWEKRLRELGSSPPEDLDTLKERFRRWILVQLGTNTALKRIEATESRDIGIYEHQLSLEAPEEDHKAIAAVQQEEKVHEKILHSMVESTPGGLRNTMGGGTYSPQLQLEAILGRERWHVRSGGWIGQAIYGANDGLGAVFGIVSGMAGYTGGSEVVLISGLAGMLASALSMGSGAYLATKSEREVYEAELERERKEIIENPEEEREELQLFYELKGFSKEEAELLANRLAEQPEHMLKTLAHEELGLSEATFPHPWKAAASATLSTAFGAFIPIIPFFFAHGMPAVITSMVISTAAHFLIGASKTIVTGRSWLTSGTEMTVVGVVEAAITYALGVLLSPGHPTL